MIRLISLLNSNMAKNYSASQKQLAWIEPQKPNNFRTKIFFWELLFNLSIKSILLISTNTEQWHAWSHNSVGQQGLHCTRWREYCSINVYHKKTLSWQAVNKSPLWLSEKRTKSNYLPAFCSLKPLSVLANCRMLWIFKASFYSVDNSIFRNLFLWVFVWMTQIAIVFFVHLFVYNQKSYKQMSYWTESCCLLF